MDGRTNDGDGIKRLLVAVLDDCIRLLLRSTRDTVLARELAWLLSDDDHHPFTFRQVCLVLELDPQIVRRAVLRQRTFPVWMMSS